MRYLTNSRNKPFSHINLFTKRNVMPIMQIYERPVALDRNIHQGIRINNLNCLFASACQTAILAVSELNQATKEFPVVFVKENDHYLATAILGLQQNQNLFVDDIGKWTARYTPAFIRRFPFVPAIGQNEDELMTVCIDEASACVNPEIGEPLFVDGKNSEFLEKNIQFLQDYKTQTDIALSLVKQLADADLLSEKTANFKLVDGETFNLTGFLTVDAEKLSKLPQETVFALFQTGALHLAYLHLTSLDNWDRLIGLHTERARNKSEKRSTEQNMEHA